MAIVGRSEYRIVLETVVSGLDGDESGRQRPSYRVRRTVVRAPTAIGAGIKVEHVLPGEIAELFSTERLHLIEMLVTHAPAYRLDGSAIEFRKVHIEQRCFHVKLYSEGAVAQQEV